MLRNVKSLTGYTMGATDGELGKVEEFYFDDESWTARYLVVTTGGWLFGRKVLISPVALEKPDKEHKIFPVRLTKGQIKESPDVDTEKPVSRQQEIELHTHYDWPFLDRAGIGFYGGIGMMGMIDSRVPFEDSISEKYADDHFVNPHLRSTNEMKGYHIHALDGDIGEVEDFIIDDESWQIRFLVIDTGNWLPGKKVLISPKWISGVNWSDSSVIVDLPVEDVKNSPVYDPSVPLEETYEAELSVYYGRSIDQ